MTDDPPSPFAPAPSARPPSLVDANVSIRVSSPGVDSNLEPLPLSRTVTERPPREDARLPATLVKADIEAPRPRRAKRLVFLASIAVGALGILTLAGWALNARTRRTDDPARITAKAEEPTAIASVVAPVAVSSSASVPVSVAPPPVTRVRGTARPKSFDSGAARAELDALAPKLTDCRIPRGRAGRIRLVFSTSGTVSSTTLLSPYAGTPEGACVEAHLKKARVAPFTGQAAPLVYTFVSRR